MSEIRFPYDREKAWQAILWFAGKHGGSIDLLKLVKLLFYADREHLVRYGRPITGGTYRALPLGPVASDVLDDLKASATRSMPFKRDGADPKHPVVHAVGKVDETALSESDFEVLEDVNREFGHIDQIRLYKMTHETKAYKKNFKEGHASKSFPLPYEDFFLDVPPAKRAILKLIREDAEARACLGS